MRADDAGGPSLRRRLLASVLLPAALAAAVLGVGGAFIVHDVVETMQDRSLDGSVLAIAERLTVDDDDELIVDLPPMALGMLESHAGDSIYYNVSYDGGMVSGYRRLPLPGPGAPRPPVGTMMHGDASVDGIAVRVASQYRRVYGRPAPVLVQVAETRNGRRALQARLLWGLGLLELGLLGLVVGLAFAAVGRGLRPLTRLGAEIRARAVPGAMLLAPLPLDGLPAEVLAPVLAFNALLARFAAAMASVERFTADASHQLRTPLAILRTHIALLQRSPPRGLDAAGAEGTLEEIDAAVRRLERLVVQLLEMARADHGGGLGTEASEVDIVPVIREVVRDQVPLALAKGVEIEFEGPPHPAVAVVVPALVSEVARNLVANAIAYNRPGGLVVARVVVGTSVEFQVADEGPGIPAAERDLVFERFFRGAASRGEEGSGLGLAIVRSLADRLGASVVLRDRAPAPGLEATVTFRRPGGA